jgi:hypothetical protein
LIEFRVGDEGHLKITDKSVIQKIIRDFPYIGENHGGKRFNTKPAVKVEAVEVKSEE